MAVTLCQVMGFVLGLLGVGGLIAATGMDMWSTEDLYDNPVTAVYSYAGLWRSCVRQSSGFTECRPYFTILGLPVKSSAVGRDEHQCYGRMATLMLQLVGFMLSVLGTFLISSATAMDMWTVEDRAFTLVTSIYAYYGLWYSCVGTEYGTTQCRPYFTILGLPGLFQGVRALMIVGIVLGVIGVLIAIFALKCLRMGNMEDRVKATMTLTSGVMFVIAGICGIAGVSIFANLIVTNFALTTYTSAGLGMVGSGLVGSPLTPRYTFGSALFVGWVGGGVLFVGGVMLCLACRGLMPEKHYEGTAYKPATQSAIYRSEGYPKTHNSSYKAQSMDGRPSNQRFDYV